MNLSNSCNFQVHGNLIGNSISNFEKRNTYVLCMIPFPLIWNMLAMLLFILRNRPLTYLTIKSLLHKKSFSKCSTFKQIDIFLTVMRMMKKKNSKLYIFMVSFTNINFSLSYLKKVRGNQKCFVKAVVFFFFNLSKA